MNEERFTVMKKFDGSYVICDKGKMLVADDCCDLLNELNKDFEELGISIKLFEDDIATKDKKIEEQQAEIERLKELERKIDRQESIINIILNNLPIHQAADIQKLVAESLKEWDS